MGRLAPASSGRLAPPPGPGRWPSSWRSPSRSSSLRPRADAATDYILMSRSALLARPVSGTARNVPDGSHTVVVRAPGASDHPPSQWPTCIS
jgi:hypothetical protein